MLWGSIEVQTQVSTNQATLNEPFVYAIVVLGENEDAVPKVTAPNFPENLPFQVLRREQPRPSHNSQTTIINGKVTSSNTYTLQLLYQLKPKFEGQHQIPAMDIEVNGERYQTEPITISISKASPADGNSAQVIAKFSTDQTMLGESIALSYDILIPVQFGARNLAAQLPVDFLRENFTVTNDWDWEQLPWRKSHRLINGVSTQTFHLEIQLIPKHEGTFTLPAAVLSYQVPDQQRRRRGGFPGSFFDDDFFGGDPLGMFGSYREVTVASEDITLQVQPLPTEGQPADFTGIIGHLQANATLSATEVTVGEPIILDLTLSGAPQLASAKLPDFSKNTDFSQHFRIAGDDPAVEQEGKAVFQRTLRATHAGALTLPAFEFSYYDPDAKEYRLATTQPIPLKVAAARQITLQDAQGDLTGTPAAQSPAAQTSVARTSGLEPNFPPEELRSREMAPFMPSPRFGQMIPWLAIPPCVWLLCFVITLVARHRVANVKGRAASGAKAKLLRTVNSLKDNSEAPEKFAAALQEFFTARFQLPPGTITYADAEAAALQKGFSSEQIEPFRKLFEMCEASQYAGGSFDLSNAQSALKTALKPF